MVSSQTHHRASSLGEPGVTASHQNQNADVHSLGSILFKPNLLPKTLIRFLKEKEIHSKLELHILPLNLKASKYVHCLKKKFGSACGLSSGFEGIWRMGRFWPRSPRFATATCCPTQPRKSSHRPRNRWPPGRSANDVCKRCNYLPGHL